MPYELKDRLVVGISSRALFDLDKANQVFEKDGAEEYRKFQRENLDNPLAPGVAFEFIKRLLSLNDLSPSSDDPLVEVIVLSRNDPVTGLRVMRSVENHGLKITRAIFMEGRSPYKYMNALHMSLFMSANEKDVREAVLKKFPAGQVIGLGKFADDDDKDLRIAFDFDGVLADDDSQKVHDKEGLASFHAHEDSKRAIPLGPGPLKNFLEKVNKIQRLEAQKQKSDPSYRIRVHVSIITARNAPAHERAVTSLNEWGVRVNDGFFLGGIEKVSVLRVLNPHIYFDDQKTHLELAALGTPCVHVPFGNSNTTGDKSPPTVRSIASWIGLRKSGRADRKNAGETLA